MLWGRPISFWQSTNSVLMWTVAIAGVITAIGSAGSLYLTNRVEREKAKDRTLSAAQRQAIASVLSPLVGKLAMDLSEVAVGDTGDVESSIFANEILAFLTDLGIEISPYNTNTRSTLKYTLKGRIEADILVQYLDGDVLGTSKEWARQIYAAFAKAGLSVKLVPVSGDQHAPVDIVVQPKR